MAAIQPIPAGSLIPVDVGNRVAAEFGKLDRFLRDNKDVATIPISKLPVSTEQRERLRIGLGGELNVHEGKSVVKQDAILIRQSLKTDKTLSKDEKAFLGALATVTETTGEIEELLAKGKTSYTTAFKYKKLDTFVRACLTLADKPCFGTDTSFALQFIDKLETFKEKLPDVMAALSKSADKIQKVRTKNTGSPFRKSIAPAAASNPNGEGASASDRLPPELASRFGAPRGQAI